MKTSRRQPVNRDRTYRIDYDGDYLNRKQYLTIAIVLSVTHFLFEFWYLWLRCTPMAILNVFSFFSYIVSAVIILKTKNTLITVWIMVMEVFIHVICACIFLGTACGYQLWLFGTIANVFFPFYNPDLSKVQKKQIGVFSLIVIGTYVILTALNNKGVMPTTYNPSPEIAKLMYYFNALLAFSSIMLYTRIYNNRVGEKQQEQNSLRINRLCTSKNDVRIVGMNPCGSYPFSMLLWTRVFTRAQ